MTKRFSVNKSLSTAKNISQSMTKNATTNIIKTAPVTTQPSNTLNFNSSVPVEKSMYKMEMFDNPDYWGTEYGYLGDAAADAAATAPDKPWYEKLVDVYGAYQATRTAQKMQDQLARENAARASAGKQPISMDSYAKYAAPQVNVGLSPNVMNMLLYGGLGLGGILLFSMIMRKPARR